VGGRTSAKARSLVVVLVGLVWVSSATGHARGTAVDEGVYKGTHNSYLCEGQCLGQAECDLKLSCDFDSPWMNHSPRVQIEDFGVWVLELDYSVVDVNGQLRLKVGHNTEHDEATCWGNPDNLLANYLSLIRSNRSFDYRPTIIYFEKKPDWGLCGSEAACYLPVLDNELMVSLGREHIFGPYDLKVFQEARGRLPTVTELAGKVLPISLECPCGNALVFSDAPNALFRVATGGGIDECTTASALQSAIDGGANVVRSEQYQGDWTFDYGLPPNPLVVDAAATPPWRVTDSKGDHWCCENGDVWKGQVVGEHGTFRFPYKTVSAAVNRAKGYVPGIIGGELKRRGLGWTLLMRPGNYAETLTINYPVTLKKDDSLSGQVIIGR